MCPSALTAGVRAEGVRLPPHRTVSRGTMASKENLQTE